MLTLSRVSIRQFSTSRLLFAAKTSGPKASAQGFKKNDSGSKSSKKSSGSFRFYPDHIHTGRFAAKSPIQSLPNVEPFHSGLRIGAMTRYTETQKQRLIQCGAFKKDQFLEIFHTPLSLIREETKQLEQVVSNGFTTASSLNRVCLIGEGGIGKSTLLAQSLAIALENEDSVIIPVPHALRLVDGSNDYWFDSKLGTYTQPMYTKALLGKIRHANVKSLAKIPLSKEYTIESVVKGRSSIKFNTQHSLFDLVKSNVPGRLRGQVLQILVDELLTQSQAPVFLAVDNFSALTSSSAKGNSQTAYKSPENKPLLLKDFQLTKLIMDLTSGAKSFAKGAILLSTSADDRKTQTLEVGLGLSEDKPYTSSYTLNRDLASQLTGVKPLQVSKLSKEHVGAMVGVLAEAGAFRKAELEQSPLEQIVAQKYILSGNGNPLELIKSVVLSL